MSGQSSPDDYRLGNSRIRVVLADLTTLSCDGIVNAANDRLWMGGGVAGAIKRRGGDEIEREAVRLGPVPIGDAVATGAGRLRARYVIHAVTMGQDLTTSEGRIRDATRSALRLAERLGLHSIALPALGTGVGGFPPDRAATVMVDEAIRHLSRSGRPAEVVFVLLDPDARRVFVRALQEAAADPSRGLASSTGDR